MSHRLPFRLGLSLLVALLAPLAGAQTVSQIRLMLHPYAAAPGELPADALARLQNLAGVPLTLSGTTRTGGLEFALAAPIGAADAAAMLRRLRDDRSVLWAESVRPTTARPSGRPGALGSKLMVRLAGDVAPDWNTLLPRWMGQTGAAMTVQRQIGNVWVLSLFSGVPEDQLAQMAEQLQADPAVQYADPATHAFPLLVPNDPLYPFQWALQDPKGGVNAPTAWDLQTGSASVNVAVLDTGITQHPELANRILPGYDFITDPLMANDGDGRDPDASDPGDGVGDNDCGDGIARQSSFHGTFVSGIIAANTNNGAGISGLDFAAKILPVRVLGRCGGTFDDILAGLLWASGAPVAGVPPNPNPARVINMSLGGTIGCPQAVQDAINTALAQGTVIAVAAGNQGDDATTSAPANCSGVITVGASTREGERASYSNFGQRVDVSAPGGDGTDVSGWVLSIGNDPKGPGNPIFEYAIGTSAAAPHVAAAASLMIARNSTLTPGRILDILTGAARPFTALNSCGTDGTLCGSGILDIALSLQSTLPGTAAPPGTVAVIEYYRADLDHYFYTADPAEAAFVDTFLSGIFQRTGEVFYAWADPALAPPGAKPVCRFYAGGLFNSHYFTADAFECQFIIVTWPGVWLLETFAAFYVVLPDGNGQCPAGMLPVYKFFDGRQDANQRHTIDLSVQRAMINRAWVPQGFGPNHVAFCSPV
jgi:serine protease